MAHGRRPSENVNLAQSSVMSWVFLPVWVVINYKYLIGKFCPIFRKQCLNHGFSMRNSDENISYFVSGKLSFRESKSGTQFAKNTKAICVETKPDVLHLIRFWVWGLNSEQTFNKVGNYASFYFQLRNRFRLLQHKAKQGAKIFVSSSNLGIKVMTPFSSTPNKIIILFWLKTVHFWVQIYCITSYLIFLPRKKYLDQFSIIR